MPSPSRAHDLRLRFVSALALGPPVLVAAWFGGLAFELVVGAFTLLAVREWVRLVEPERTRFALPLSFAAIAAVVGIDIWGGTAAALWAALAITGLLYVGSRLSGVRHPWLIACAVPYLALACIAIVWLRTGTGEMGLALCLFLLLVIWATDIGAYAAGRSIGGPKLWVRISPKKTWAGLVGGMVSAGLVGGGVALVFGANRPLLAVLVAAVLAVVGQAGDMFESFMKRRSHVKDSGHLIPGHGGLLDRIDGLVVAAPLFALFHAAAGGALQWW